MPNHSHRLDSFVLSVFVILMTLHPYFLKATLNLFELGLYLPGIQALLNGQIPYRDFFHLRGPFELYFPAGLMALLGKEIWVLETYFYVGTVLTLIVCVLLGAQLYRTRWALYLMVPILVARTFPRVVFTFWGGMRYGLGVMAILFAIRFFKTEKKIWIFAAGLVSAFAILTSVEIGLAAVGSILTTFVIALALNFIETLKTNYQKLNTTKFTVPLLSSKKQVGPQDISRSFTICFGRLVVTTTIINKAKTTLERRNLFKSCGYYFLGFLSLIVPYVIYLISMKAFQPCLESMFAVFPVVFDIYGTNEMTKGPWHTFLLMFQPWASNFKFMSPTYLYLFIFAYLIFRFQKNRGITPQEKSITCLGIYGLILYLSAFRNIQASQFEMALQPEKVLLFFLFEDVYLYLKTKGEEFRERFSIKNNKAVLARMFLIALIIISLGFSIQRFIRMMQKDQKNLKLFEAEHPSTLSQERLKFLTLPLSQAQEFEAVTRFIQTHTQPHEPVFMFPELGVYSFVVDRPFVGRFPMVTSSWLNPQWHEELLDALKTEKPHYAVLSKTLPDYFQTIHFHQPQNRVYYETVRNFILKNYHIVQKTSDSYIYELNHSVSP